MSDPGLEWMADNHAYVVCLCAHAAGPRQDMMPDLYGECVDRVQSIFKTWDPERCTLKTHMTRSLRWYLWKVMNRRARTESLSHDHPCWASRTDAAEVYSLLDAMPEDMAYLLRLRYIENYTRDEIAQALGLSIGTVKKRLKEAIDDARQRL